MNLTVTFASDIDNPRELITTKKIGHGKFEVYHAQGSSASEEYAIKLFPRDDLSKNRYWREKDLLASLDHPHIIKHYPVTDHTIEDFPDCDFLVLDYATHGDFFDIVTKGGLAHEVHMRTYFHQLIVGLEFLHSQAIAHLDLKLENLLMGKDFLLKIIDFDQSQIKGEEKLISGGTSSYRAPEIKDKCCQDMFAADIYSAGIILFAFKTGQFPFVEIEKERQAKMLYYDLFLENNEEFWELKAQKMGKKSDFFSDDFKALLRGMLDSEPAKRMTIQDIKNSEWYNKPVLSPEGLKFHMSRVCQRINQK